MIEDLLKSYKEIDNKEEELFEINTLETLDETKK